MLKDNCVGIVLAGFSWIYSSLQGLEKEKEKMTDIGFYWGFVDLETESFQWIWIF